MLTTKDEIIVTGAAGFIGSCLVGYLNDKGFENVVVVDEFERREKDINLQEKYFSHKPERQRF
jgi:ADP-L-glycero-D-manno-heptose 6-epimerase